MSKQNVVFTGYDIDKNSIVLNIDTVKIEKYNSNKHKDYYCCNKKFIINEKSYINYFNRYNRMVVMSIGNVEDNIYTICKLEEDNILAIKQDGSVVKLNINNIQQLLNENKINNLRLSDGYIIFNNKKASEKRLDVPSWLKTVCDDSWCILGVIEDETDDSASNTLDNGTESKEEVVGNCTSDNEYSDKKSSIQCEKINDTIIEKEVETGVVNHPDKKSDESVKNPIKLIGDIDETDYELNITEENINNIALQSMSYTDFYTSVLDNTEIGDIVSLPKAILNQLSFEIVKFLESNMSCTKKTYIVRLNTHKGIKHSIFGIMTEDDESNKCKFQVMQRFGKSDSKSITEIELDYVKWKQSRKYITV